MSVNKIILLGNLVANPEFRSMQDGKEIANFTVATNETWKDKTSGEKKEKVEYHKVIVFSQALVKIIKEGKAWIKKGTRMYLEGQIQTRKWTDQSGIDRYSTEIILNDFNSIIDVQPQGGKEQAEPSPQPVPSADQAGDGELDNDIPF